LRHLRGRANFHQRTSEAISEALPLFNKAIELDPDFASAYAMAAWCFFSRKIFGWIVDRNWEIAEGLRLARCAVALGQDDAVALARSGHAIGHLAGDLEGGIALIKKARALDPDSVTAWFLGGFLHAFAGESDIAIQHFEYAMRLSPLDREMFRMWTGIAFAHLLAGRFDAASSCAQKSFTDLPTFLFAVTACRPYARGQRAMCHLRCLHPALRISK